MEEHGSRCSTGIPRGSGSVSPLASTAQPAFAPRSCQYLPTGAGLNEDRHARKLRLRKFQQL